ncbi:MAG: hypothetical protein CL748_06195 [Chloroflexi bacterium]|nr:hypothetical protein [Chloroflexota bacterium]|tara:strand:+ start:219 stop:458 length:240 start_codon:yes stop_codon:yes gene_type:complete
MNVLNKINLIDQPVKAQIIKLEEIIDTISNDNNDYEIYTNEEIIIKYIPSKILKKNINIKISMSNEIWKIKLKKEKIDA